MKAVSLEVVVRKGGATEAETQFIGQHIIVQMYRIECKMACRVMRDGLQHGRQSILP